jgi:hypothetical protein
MKEIIYRIQVCMENTRWEKIKDPQYTVEKNVTILVRISSIVSNVNIVHNPSAYMDFI